MLKTFVEFDDSFSSEYWDVKNSRKLFKIFPETNK